jgi:sugar diacid utilization regulator
MGRELPSEPAPLSPALRERIERAYRSRGRQVREIAELCRSQFPHYRALSGDGLASLYSNIDRVVGAFYRLQLVEGRLPTSEELEPQRRAARLRVAQGVPLQEMVGAYLCGLGLLWTDLVAGLEADRDVQGELLQRVPVTIAANTLVATAATEAYVEERERRMRSRDEAVDEMLRLFAEGEAPLGVLEARAHALGLGLDSPRTAALFRPAPGSAEAAGSAVDVVRGLLADRQLADGIVIGRVAEGVLALLPEGAERAGLEDVAGKLRGHGWRTGLGSAGADAAGLSRSVREAARAVEIGELLGLEGALDRYAELAVLDLVDVGSPRALDFARRVLGPLADPDASGKSLETLRAMCQNGFRLKLAAAALGVHPHTLAYRLEQLRRRHGLDLDDAETRLRVHLAVLILGR